MISKEDIEKTARLAALDFTDSEKEKAVNQLQNIMKMIDQILDVDCTDVKPLSSVCEEVPFYRKDEVTAPDLGGKLFSNAPGKNAEFAKEIKCFIVPKVVE
jgi:aspartyl-tRNA(Asn)/glutamyl-tRNA(Gln) amidotransferase subunit C